MKNKKIMIIIVSILLALMLQILFPISEVLATDEIETIQFQDENLYKGIVKILEEMKEDIGTIEKDDNQLQIKMKKEELLKVDDITLHESGIKNLSGIEKFTNLKVISIDHNEVTDVSIVKDMENLETLDLCYNPLPENLDFIEDMTNLTEIWLVGTNRKKLPNLDKLKNLEKLYISENELEDISTIEGLEKLKELIIADNNISKTIKQNGVQTIKLPDILIKAKNQNSKLYTSNNYSLINCTLTEDGKSIVIDTDKVANAKISIKSESPVENLDNGILFVNEEITLNIKIEKSAIQKPDNENKNQNKVPDNTQAPKIFPKTGKSTSIIWGTTIAIIFMIACYMKYKKFKNIDK